MTQITDIFGNKINVSNLQEAISETKKFVNFSTNAGNNDFSFDEFKLIESVDIWGKPFKSSQRVENGKSVKSLEYYQYQLNQLLAL